MFLVASDHWHKLLERWREQRRERGRPLWEEPVSVSDPGSDAHQAGPDTWLPGSISLLVESLSAVRVSLPVLGDYGLDADDLAGFIALSDPDRFRRVQSVDDRLWKELEQRLGETDLRLDDPGLERNDQARYAIFSARLARDTVQALDTAVQVFSPRYGAATLYHQVRGYLYASADADVSESLREMANTLSSLPDLIEETWVVRSQRVDGTAVGRVALEGTRQYGYYAWNVLLEDLVGAVDSVRAAGAVQFPLFTVLGPAGVVAAESVRRGLEELMYQQAVPEVERVDRRFSLLDGRNRKWAAVLVSRFGRSRLYQLRDVLRHLERLVVAMITLRLIQLRRAHLHWDALLTEVVFESRLREWRIAQLRFFVQRVLPVLESLVMVEDIMNALELEGLVEPFQALLDDIAAFVGRVVTVLQEMHSEGAVRRRYLTADLVQAYSQVSGLVRLRVAIRRALDVIDEFLALPEVTELVPALGRSV